MSSEERKPKLFPGLALYGKCADAMVLAASETTSSQRIYMADQCVKDVLSVSHYRSDERGGYSIAPFTQQSYVRVDALPESLRVEVFKHFEKQLLAAEEEQARKELAGVLKVLPSDVVDVPPEIDFTWDLSKSAPID